MTREKTFTITKRIAKHGKQAVIVVPKLLEESLKPGTIVQVVLEVIGEAENE